MLTSGKDYIHFAWWLSLFPGLAILATEFLWAQRLIDWAKARLKRRRPPSAPAPPRP